MDYSNPVEIGRMSHRVIFSQENQSTPFANGLTEYTYIGNTFMSANILPISTMLFYQNLQNANYDQQEIGKITHKIYTPYIPNPQTYDTLFENITNPDYTFVQNKYRLWRYLNYQGQYRYLQFDAELILVQPYVGNPP